MLTIQFPLPLQFFFRCPRCGEYRVSEETLRRFLSKRLKKKLSAALKQGAHGAVLSFTDGCTACEPNDVHEAELSVLWPRKN